MPKKARRKSMKQTQKQEQRQNISIKIGELPTKKRRRRPRKGALRPGGVAPLRQLPPVVYQTLPQLTYYGKPNESGTITAEPAKPTTIVEPVKAKTSILEDIGMVGTEGPVEIIDVPTKRETLAELVTPVDIPRMQVDPVQEGKFDFTPMQVDPVQNGPFDLPRQIIDPVEAPTTILSPPAAATTILEPKQKRSYTKSGKYSKKGQPEPQRDVSPLTFEGSFGIAPQSVYTETEILYASPKARLYTSPMTQISEPTKFREETPEKGFFTQKDVNKFFQPRKRDTSPKPKPKGQMIIKGDGPLIKGRKSMEIL